MPVCGEYVEHVILSLVGRAMWQMVCAVGEQWEAVEELFDGRRNVKNASFGGLPAAAWSRCIGGIGLRHDGCVQRWQTSCVAKSLVTAVLRFGGEVGSPRLAWTTSLASRLALAGI